MYKMIGGDGVQYGPVTAEQLREWIAEHRANRHTLVQLEEGAEWVPLGQLGEFTEALVAAEKTWEHDAEARVVADEGAGEGPLQCAVAPLPVMDCLGQGWALLGRHFGLTVGGAALLWLVLMMMAFGTCIGGMVGLVVSGPLYGGLTVMYLKLIRGQEASLKDLFSSFGEAFVPLMLVWVVSWLVSEFGLMICILPGVFLKIIWVFGLPLVADVRMPFWSALELSRQTVMRQFLPVVGLLLLAYLPLVVFETYALYKIGVFVSANFAGFNFDFSSAEFREKMDDFLKLASAIGMQEQFVLLLNLPFATASVLYAYEHFFKRTPGQVN